MNIKNFLFFIFVWFCIFVEAQDKRVLEVKINGAEKTRTSFLQHLLTLESGMVLDSLVMEKDITRLKRLPSVSHAFYEIEKESDDGCVVLYTIEENFTLIPFANLFSSSNDDFAFRIGLQEFNLLGRNMTLGGFYQYDIF